MRMNRNTESGGTARDEARPTAADLSRYQRSYQTTTDQPERIFWLWQEALAHAQLLEQQSERSFPEHGNLTALQMAEGARAHARLYAFMLAEAPAREIGHIERKIMVAEAMAFDEEEINRSRTAVMIEAAMQQDARELGITLRKAPMPPGSPSRH